jgi:hypothetical protein
VKYEKKATEEPPKKTTAKVEEKKTGPTEPTKVDYERAK